MTIWDVNENFQKKNDLGFWLNLILILDNYCCFQVLWYPYRFRFGETFNISNFKLTAVNLWKPNIPISNEHVFFKYAFLFVMVRSMQEGGPLKQISFFIRCSILKESVKSCKLLSSGVLWNLSVRLILLDIWSCV